jgi:AcrR family transcriptional regulator
MHDAMKAANIKMHVAVSGALSAQALRVSLAMLTMSTFYSDMLTASTPLREDHRMKKKGAGARPSGERQYHHGNLRAALIEAGLKLIQQKGVRALTLREIGARAGVSRMAAYRHFADKEDLLEAICEAGFSQFADTLDEARRKTPSGFARRMRAMALAYVRFASKHPAYYEVMFSWRGDAANRPKATSESGARAFKILEETIREGQERGDVRKGDTVMLARLVWAQVHGISMLRLEPDLSPEGAGTRFVEFSSDVMLSGLAPTNS